MAIVAGTTSASAGWPVARHDARRTGAFTGQSHIVDPAVAWRAYLGGAIKPESMLTADIDQDGVREVLYATGGSVVAKRPDDSQIWRTRTFGQASLLGLLDLDGDGVLEVVAQASRQVVVLDAASGGVRWRQPAGEMGRISYTRIADADGDGLPDILIGECGGCGESKPQTGFIYSFGVGFVSPKRVEMAAVGGVNRVFTTGDVDGDGAAELLLGETSSTLALLDGKTGIKLGNSGSIGETMAWSSLCVPADVDGSPGDEFVCLVANSPEPVPTPNDNRMVLAIRYQPASGALETVWSHALPAAEALSAAYNDVRDIDGDGQSEIVVTGRDSGGMFTTHVLDLATGNEVALLAGQRFAGVVALQDGPPRAVLTTQGTTVSAWSYDPLAPQKLALLWALPDRVPWYAPDWDRLRTSSIGAALPVAVPSGAASALVLRDAWSSDLFTYQSGPSGAQILGTLQVSAGVETAVVWPVESTGGGTIAVARTDGVLGFFTPSLQPGATAVRYGGHFAPGGWREMERTPVTGPAGGVPDQIFAVDSKGSLVRLDASNADPENPPVPVWEVPDTTVPSFVEVGLGAGAPAIAAVYADTSSLPPTYALRAIHADTGETIWQAPLDVMPYNNIVPGRVDSDVTPDLVLQWGDPATSTLTTAAVSGLDGSTLWVSALPVPCGLQPAGLAVADWDGDGREDVVHQAMVTHVLSGLDGSEIASSDALACYFLPTLTDTNGDAQDEVVLHGGYSPTNVLSHDLKAALYTSAEDDRPYPYGAIAQCPDGPVLVQGSWSHPARLKMTLLNGGSSSTLVLASGAQFVDEDSAIAADAGMGQLSSVNVHSNLTGSGLPSAVVGSMDGWLYAVEPCSGALQFAYDFGSSVGEAIFSDTDADGEDEILVSVADGYLYAIEQALLPGPAEVLDTDPAQGIVDVDVDERPDADGLSAVWSAVPGATSYEVSAIDEATGEPLTDPPWSGVGSAKSFTLEPLATEPGRRYLFAVRAIDVWGRPSAHSLSDGVLISDASGAGGGGGDSFGRGSFEWPTLNGRGGCFCRVGQAGGGGSGLLALALGVGVAFARRRLARSRGRPPRRSPFAARRAPGPADTA